MSIVIKVRDFPKIITRYSIKECLDLEPENIGEGSDESLSDGGSDINSDVESDNGNINNSSNNDEHTIAFKTQKKESLLYGTIFIKAAQLTEAKKFLCNQPSEIQTKCKVVAGNYSDNFPKGDVYILNRVLSRKWTKSFLL